MNCVFCGIVSGAVPSLKVYEDEHALVFMDVARDVDGHMVAIPKEHVGSILDCDEETLRRLMRAIKAVSCRCVSDCGYEGVNLLHASGESAGQSIPHLHFHLIPRKRNDGIDAWPSFPGSKEEPSALWQRLKA